jgi:excisionase family DNA binding protein
MQTNPFELIDARLASIENLLQELKQVPPAGVIQPTEELLSVQQAAEFLRLSVPTIYAMTSKGELPFMKRSKRCYFSKSDLINYLKEGRQKSNSEIAQDAKDHKARGKK